MLHTKKYIVAITVTNLFMLKFAYSNIVLIEDEVNFENSFKERSLGTKTIKVSIYNCLHKVKQYDNFLTLIRKIGYRSPYNINLKKYSKISDIIQPDSLINLPIVILETPNNKIKDGLSCSQIVALDKEKPFIIRGKEAQVKKVDNQILFFPGFTRSEYDYYEKRNNFPKYTFRPITKSNFSSQKTIDKSKQDISNKKNEGNKNLTSSISELEIRANFRKNLKNDVRNELKEELKNDVKDELREELKNDVRNELKEELKNDVKDELIKQLKDQLKANTIGDLRDYNKKKDFIKDHKDVSTNNSKNNNSKYSIPEKQSRLTLSTFGIYNSFYDKNNPIIIVSQLQPGVNVTLHQLWHSNLSTHTSIGFFIPEYITQNSNLSNPSKLLYKHINFGYKYNLTSLLAYQVDFNLKELPYYKQVQEDEFSILKDQLSYIKLSTNYNVLEYGKLKGNFITSAEGLISAGVYNSSNVFGVGFEIKNNYSKNQNINTSFSYEFGENSTDGVEFTTREMKFGLSWEFDF